MERCWEQDLGGSSSCSWAGCLLSLEDPRGVFFFRTQSVLPAVSRLAPHLLPPASVSIIDSESGSALVGMGVSHVKQSHVHRGPQVRCPCRERLPTLLSASGPGAGVGGAAAKPASVRPWLCLCSWAPAANSPTHTLGGQPSLRRGHSIIPVTDL